MIPKIEDQQSAKLGKIEETPALRQILSNEKLMQKNHEKNIPAKQKHRNKENRKFDAKALDV